MRGLPGIVRWEPFHRHQGTRRQDTLQHTYALTIFTTIFLARITPYVKLDHALLLRAVLVHDHGEGELGRDVLVPDKKPHLDVEEYLAFCRCYKDLPEFELFQEAFLLQFCLSMHTCLFPLDAHPVLRRLSEDHEMEALAFAAIELLDYLFYATEQYLEQGNRDILAHVLGNTRTKLDHLSQHLPGLAQVFWTPEFIAWCETNAEGGNPAMPEGPTTT